MLNSLFTFIVFPLTSVSQRTVDWSRLLSPQSYMRDYLNCEASGQSSAFFVPECWVVGGDTHQTIRVQTVLLSPELLSWREKEEKLFSLRHWMYSTYPNPNFSTSPDLFLIGLECCLFIWFSEGWGVGCFCGGRAACPKVAASGWWRVQRVCLFRRREGKGQGA